MGKKRGGLGKKGGGLGKKCILVGKKLNSLGKKNYIIGLDGCYDCTAETRLLRLYKEVWGPGRIDTRRISRELGRGIGPGKKGR